jgi:hypothetical protein
VNVTPDATEPRLAWVKSSYSNGAGGECVETAFVPSGVFVRDSKRPRHTRLTVSAEAWAAFVADVSRS